jgi:hypothetical protein
MAKKDILDNDFLPIGNKEFKTNSLDVDTEAISKLRDDTLNKLKNHVDSLKTMIKKDDLANYMLENRIDILEKSKYMLNEYMVSVLTAKISDPRAFEVLSQLIKTVADVNDSVVNIKDDKSKLVNKEEQEKFMKNTADLVGDMINQNLNMFHEQNKFKDKDKKEIKIVASK